MRVGPRALISRRPPTFQSLYDQRGCTLSTLFWKGAQEALNGSMLCIQTIDDFGGVKVKVHNLLLG
jgi:hypothetical protein